MKLVLAAGALVAAALVVPTDAGAKCAMTELAPKLLTPDGAKLPADGGVLVGYEVRVPEDYSKRARTLAATFTGKDGNSTVELTARQIAPGVFVYSAKAGKGSLTLNDGKTKVGTFARGGTDKNDLPAPDASKAVVTINDGRRYRSVVFSVDVAAVPEAAFGVITYDDKGTALSFATVPHDKAGKTTIQPYHSPGRCAFDPDGTATPMKSAVVTFAWVDKFGRIGKPSNAVTVGWDSKGGPDDD